MLARKACIAYTIQNAIEKHHKMIFLSMIEVHLIK